MRKLYIVFALLLSWQTTFAQDVHQDVENDSIPEDIAHIISESLVLMESAEADNVEAYQVLLVNILPIFRKYPTNSRLHFKTLLAAAGYYYKIHDCKSAVGCMSEFFQRFANSGVTYEELGYPESLDAYRIYALSLEGIHDYNGVVVVSQTGLQLSHMMGDSLAFHAIEFSVFLATAYGLPWSSLKDDEKFHQYLDTCVHYLSSQDFSRENMARYVATNVALLATICYARKEMDKAMELLSPCMPFFDSENATIEDLAFLNTWICICAQLKRYDEVRKYAPITMKLEAETMTWLNSVFSESSLQQTSYQYDIYNESILSSAANIDFGSALGDIYNYLLFRKNLLLRTSLNIIDALQKVEDTRIREYFADYRYTCEKLDYEKQRKHPNPSLEDSLRNRVEELDRILTNYVYQHRIEEPVPTWQDIQRRLSDKAVAVEYYSFSHYDGDDYIDELYAAFLITKTCEHPYMVPLFPRNDLPDRSVSDYHQKIFGNLEPYLHPGDTIYFSAHNALHSMNVEMMLLSDKSRGCDKYVPVRLTTTAQLVKPSKSYDKSAVLYGGLSYNLTPRTIRSEAMLASGIRAGVEPLPYTKKEIENIGKSLRTNGYQVTLLSGSKGNEESFKALSGHSPAIIHLATHGFYKDTNYDDERDPMLRTGLLLSGANAKALMSNDEDYDDGVLTALEISRLDLRGTELVVLSACETGLGDITPDGVWGLQRAFKRAGAETLILSLWEVEEEPTERFMTVFYDEYIQDHDKVRAFRKAQDAIRKAYPYYIYWAAFIMLD